MKYKAKREDEPQAAATVTIYIGENTFRLSESVDGRLIINKTSDGERDALWVQPRTGNEIELF